MLHRARLLAAAAILVPALTHASPILDQSNVAIQSAPTNQRKCGVNLFMATNYGCAQSFTVGVTGLLTEIDVQLDHPFADTLMFFIAASPLMPYAVPPPLRGPAGFPDTVFATGSVPVGFNSSPVVGLPYPFVSLIFTPFAVTQGQTLAILLMGPRNFEGFGVWYGTDGDTYAGGDSFHKYDDYCFIPGQGNFGGHDCGEMWLPPGDSVVRGDMGFRTFVDPVPEPASLLLLGTGIAALIAARARSRRSCDLGRADA